MRIADDDGFTLVEVLVAFAILAVTLIMVFRGVGDGARGIDTAQRSAAAIALAEAKLAALGSETPLEEGRTQGTRENGLQWRLEIAPARADDAFAEMSGLVPMRVAVAVWWTDRPDAPVELETLKFARRR